MNISLKHKLTATILAAGMLASVAVTSAFAAPLAGQSSPTSKGYTLQCQAAQCTLETDLPAASPLTLLAARTAVNALNGGEGVLPSGATVAIDDDLTLTLPVGKIVLPKADLTLTLDDENHIQQLHGTAQVPFPSFGLLDEARVVTPALAEVGLDSGASLAHLHAPLKDDRQYLFFNFGTGLAIDAASQRGSMRLSIPAGQRATLVIDTEEPLVYLAGNVTVNDPGQVALVGPLLDIAQRSELIPNSLPVWQRTQVAVNGQFSPAEGASFVEVGGAYGVGATAQWLGVDAQPLAINGWARISGDGMLLNGVVGASLAPDTVFDGELALEAWIPFASELDGAYAQISGSAAVPLASVSADATARVSLPFDVQAQAHLVTSGAEKEIAWHPGSGDRPEPTALKRAANSVSGWVGDALDMAGEGVSTGGRWISDGASSGYAWVTGLLPASRSE